MELTQDHSDRRDAKDRIIFIIATVSVLFAVAMFADFSVRYWWLKEFSFLALGGLCVVFMKQRLVMIWAIILVVISRLAIALEVYFFHLLRH